MRLRMQYFDEILLTCLRATNLQLSYILNTRTANMHLEVNISTHLMSI